MHLLNGQLLTVERLILRMPEECWDSASYQTSFCWGACCGDEHLLGSGAVIGPRDLPESELERKKGPAQRSHRRWILLLTHKHAHQNHVVTENGASVITICK